MEGGRLLENHIKSCWHKVISRSQEGGSHLRSQCRFSARITNFSTPLHDVLQHCLGWEISSAISLVPTSIMLLLNKQLHRVLSSERLKIHWYFPTYGVFMKLHCDHYVESLMIISFYPPLGASTYYRSGAFQINYWVYIWFFFYYKYESIGYEW